MSAFAKRKEKPSKSIIPEFEDLTIKVPVVLSTGEESKPATGVDYAEITAPDLDSLSGVISDPYRVSIDDMTLQLDTIDDEINELKLRKFVLEEELAGILDECKLRTVVYGDRKLAFIHRNGKSLNKDLLLKNGIPARIIDASYKNTSSRYFSYVNQAKRAEKRSNREDTE